MAQPESHPAAGTGEAEACPCIAVVWSDDPRVAQFVGPFPDQAEALRYVQAHRGHLWVVGPLDPPERSDT